MSDNPIHWTFTGRLRHMQSRQTPKGKTVHTIALEATRGEYTDVCVCDTWRSLPEAVAIGAMIHAEGRMSGREWGGKWYAGLVATSIEVAAAVDGEQDGQTDERTDGGPNDGLPF
jgi:hypothetical protein